MKDIYIMSKTIQSDETIRETVRNSLSHLGLDMLDVMNIEIGIYNATLDFATKYKLMKNWKNARFVNIYKQKALSVFANLNPDSYIGNKQLMQRLKDKEFQAQDIPFMHHISLYPKSWEDLLKRKQKDDFLSVDQKPEAMTSEFKCGKCGKRECIFHQVQLRSCDEPMTIIIKCVHCNNQWRQG